MVVTPQCIVCKREGVTTKRKATGKPLLCQSHRIARREARRSYSHDRHIKETYGLETPEYWAIYEAQGGRCYICRRATGVRKKLSVDHDHKSGMVRGLLCSACNRVLGHFRDEIEVANRVSEYLASPPATKVIGCRIVPLGGAPVKSNTGVRDGAKPIITGGGGTETPSL